MALETFDTEDTLDDGETYGIFTNQEGSSGNGYVEDGKYKSYYPAVSGNHAYLVTKDSIGSTFNFQVEFRTSTTGFIQQHSGVYLASSPPTTEFTAYSTATSLVNIFLRRTNSTFRLEVTETDNLGSKKYWNFSTNSWQSNETSWDGFSPNNDYRITITRDSSNTTIKIYDITGDSLVEEISSANSNMKSINSNAYFYFGSTQYGGGNANTVEWDNAGLIGGAEEKDFGEEMMIQQIDG